jgi:hypothetical protein
VSDTSRAILKAVGVFVLLMAVPTARFIWQGPHRVLPVVIGVGLVVAFYVVRWLVRR